MFVAACFWLAVARSRSVHAVGILSRLCACVLGKLSGAALIAAHSFKANLVLPVVLAVIDAVWWSVL
jgi:hypothetical protein